jgi:spore germination protein YaaH
MLDAADLQWMQYQLVSTIAYFGVAARSDGTLATYSTGWTGWNSSAMTGVINAAHARGVKVVLTVTMMAYDGGAQQAALLGSTTNRANLISAIVAAVRNRNADGVNLDFEPVAVAQRDQYTSFVRQLKAALVSAGVGANLTVCTMAGAASWATGYDLAGLVAPGAADALFVMGYDYSWSGSARAGGVAPMESPYILDVNQSVADYLRVVPATKIIWGVPYYGRAWRTQSSALNALTQPGASSTSVAYYYSGNLTLAARHGRLWDAVGSVPWFRYYDSAAASWVQGYYDDATSLAAKWDMVNQRGLAGTGMWALLMDAGHQDLWNLLARKFMTDTSPPVGGITAMPPTTDASAIPVSWRATDVGSGVLHYSVQVRDRPSGAWISWLTDTTSTAAHWIGQPSHAYEFRLSATDRKGNRQPWVGSPADPGTTLVVGGFANVVAETLNVRAGAGTSFGVQHTLTDGDRVFLMGGPIASGGYNWYQVQYGFTEWPSADYPRVGWAAAGSSSVPYLVPAVAPAVTTLSPTVTEVSVAPRRFSPDGDGVLDGIQLSFRLAGAGSAARLDILDGTGAVVYGRDLGPLTAGVNVATWDGRRGDGSWAPAGAYVPRITVTDASGSHVGPTMSVDATVLATWGTTADLTPPTVAASAPTGTLAAPGVSITATFSEPVVGAGPHLQLVDAASGSPVAGVATYDSTGRRATFDPSASLEAARAYRVVVEPTLRDEAGNPVSSTGWTFTTAPVGVIGFEPPAGMTFAAGSHTGYRFDGAGQVTATKTVTLAAASGAATSQRSTVLPGQPGAWLLVTNGIWAGYWIRESTRAYVAGAIDRIDYAPWRGVSFAAGSHIGYRFTSGGVVSGSKTYTLSSKSSAAASSRAVINGRPYLHIANGVWAGYWVAESSAVVLQLTPPPPPPPPVVLATYEPPQTLWFAAGTYVGRKFDAYGAVTASKSYTLGATSSAPTSQKATIPNQSGNWYYITAGVWAGYWVPESAGTTLSGP